MKTKMLIIVSMTAICMCVTGCFSTETNPDIIRTSQGPIYKNTSNKNTNLDYSYEYRYDEKGWSKSHTHGYITGEREFNEHKYENIEYHPNKK